MVKCYEEKAGSRESDSVLFLDRLIREDCSEEVILEQGRK